MIEKLAKTIDVIGLYCPMPVIKASEAIDTLKQGEVLLLLADDPGSLEDIPNWCKTSGYKLIKIEKKEKYFEFYIQK